MKEFEDKVLGVVSLITDAPAAFTNGSLFVEGVTSPVAVRILTALESVFAVGICFGAVGSETYYDFV